ncbi:MAG: hypothetical protein AAGA21_16395 [Pseudomonadota bacterium]
MQANAEVLSDANCSLSDHLIGERVISEQELAVLTGLHIQEVRRRRRKDAEEGTPGKRTPPPTWVSERRVGYRWKFVGPWMDSKTDGVESADSPTQNPAAK